MATIDGTESGDFFNRTLVGTEEADQINGRGGNDWLDGGAGADQINGGDGFDMVRYDLDPAGVKVDLITKLGLDGHGDTDTLESIEAIAGSRFADLLQGNNRANDLYGGPGDDTMRGGSGADDFWPVEGNNSIQGGPGRDRVWYDRYDGAIKLNLATGLVTTVNEAADNLKGVEDVIATDYDDVLIGSGAANKIMAGGGDDLVRAGAGSDTLDGGDGDDLLDGGSGRDMLYLGMGQDTLKGGKGRDLMLVSESFDVFSLTIDLGAQSYVVTTQGDEITGKVVGIERVRIESDTGVEIFGSDKANKLQGGTGADLLRGEGGKDTLEGGIGNDTLKGGAKADIFIFEDNFGSDEISDFDIEQKGEKIRISSTGEASDFAEFVAASRQVGKDVLYDAYQDGQSTILLKNINLEDLRASDFLFE